MPSSCPRIRALAEVVAGAAALLAFVATSPPPSDPSPDPTTSDPDFDDTAQELTAGVVLHNGLGETAVVRLRRLDAAVDVDCVAILEDPGALLSEPLLGPTESWSIPAGDNLGIDGSAGRSCEVLRLEGDGFAPRWVVWQPMARAVQIYFADEEPVGPSVLRLSPEGTGALLEGPADLLFVPGELARGTEQCAPVADGRRVAWGDPLPEGGLLQSAAWGPDGCGSVVFLDEAETPAQPWFVCVPEDSWPFVEGDRISVSPLFGSGSEGIELRVEDEAGVLLRRMQVIRGSESTAVELLSVAHAPDEGCGYDVDAACGTVSRVGRVALTDPSGASVFMAAGEAARQLELPGSPLQTRVEVLAAQERVALDPECALGPDVIGPDIAVVVTQSEVQ